MSILQEERKARDPEQSGAALAALRIALDVQRRAFAVDRSPSVEVRRERVGRIAAMMLSNRERIGAALAADFGAHPRGAAQLIETLGIAARAHYVSGQLEKWMAPAPREADPALFGTGRAYMEYQPKGVVGNIAPWNFPFDLGVGPMVEMLAAGNRVILKPSEHAPSCAALLREMMADWFDADLVYVALGGPEVARAVSELPLDHLLYTGSPGIGREVMAAAARNLTSVTLELGGKCPVVMLPGSTNAENVNAVIGSKTVKNGQMCVAPDYVLAPRAELERFAELAQDFAATALPNYAKGPDCTGIITPRHLARLEAMLNEARARQSRIVTLGADVPADGSTRRMPLRLVIDPSPELGLMKEEIFGPILPLIPYDEVDEALSRINEGERPLGLYVFGRDQDQVDHVLRSTHSGGVAVNACALQGALPSLGFGGSGASGMGRHHGIEGFREFSNQRGVVVRGEGDQTDAFFAPYAKAEAIVSHILSGGATA